MKNIHTSHLLHKIFIASLVAVIIPLVVGAVAFAQSNSGSSTAGGGDTMSVQDFYTKYLNPLIYGLGILGGIAAVGGIIWGGIQYGMSGGDAQLVTKGKATIQKALLGLVALFLLIPLFNFISPGGVNQQATNGGITAANCAKSTSFLGFKAWYAYFPDGSFGSDCSLDADVHVLPYSDPSGTRHAGLVPQVALAITDDLLRIAALVAVVFVIIGGVKYLTSQGEPAQTKQALSSIINALIGLAIAIVAAAVVSYIGKKLST